MKNKTLLVILTAFIIFSLAAATGYADMKKGYMMGGMKMKQHKEGLEGKFCSKVKFMLSNHEELELTDKQIDAVKALKFKVKRDLIKTDAEIDMAKVEMKAEMWEEKYDLTALDKIIDRKYDLKKQKAKYLVKAISDLKSILTDDQMKKAKSMWMKGM
jgi:hypothetical protein